jgi:uncharacterized protein YbbK (DUF523 family)
MPQKLLISACLLGQPVRYDGQSKPIPEKLWLKQLQAQGRLVIVCPEVVGGLPTPRPAAERVKDKVITTTGSDVTYAFIKGAEHALKLCQQHNIQHALLKANSPSCGNKQIYDGSFSGRLTNGQGITAKLLTENGIEVFSELQLDELKLLLQ